MPHWECQTLQCGNRMLYPVPAEEAHEDAGAEQILFHVYKYNVSVCKDRKLMARVGAGACNNRQISLPILSASALMQPLPLDKFHAHSTMP